MTCGQSDSSYLRHPSATPLSLRPIITQCQVRSALVRQRLITRVQSLRKKSSAIILRSKS